MQLLAVLCTVGALALGVDAGELNKYLLISAPRLSKIVYMKIGQDTVTTDLITSGLRSPQGLAIDQKNKRLFVADPDARKVFRYTLIVNDGKVIWDGIQGVAASNIETRWVAADGVGNIFFTDERSNQILKVSGEQQVRGETVPKLMYAAVEVPLVSAPGGIAVDNFNAFWTNKIMGTQVGSVVKGSENPPATNIQASAKAIAMNAAKTYGVCIANDNVYYTNQDTFVYGVKKTGGAIATISDHMIQPRGCCFDQDGTIYVADKGANSIYSFAGNMQALGPQKVTKVADFEDAFGLAYVSSSSRGVPAVCAFVTLLTLALTW